MPELPEVEHARRVLQRKAVGHRIERVRTLHPAHARRLPARATARLRGRTIERVERHGKHQLLRLDAGLTVHVHFRMSGDWHVGKAGEALPAHARVVLDLDDGTRLTLADPRALSTFTLHEAGEDPLPRLGPDPLAPAFSAEWLGAALRGRRTPIKVALLDQAIAAGVGNIYAAEALWLARISPRAPAGSLTRARLARLVDAVRQVLRFASGQRRHAYGARGDFAVYGREGEPCPRCGRGLRRIAQGGRSTWFCPACQRR